MEHQVLQSTTMFTEILMNLPVKSLMRFRCVSNRWLGFIKSESFASRYPGKETLLLKCTWSPQQQEEPDSRETLVVDQQHRVETLFSFHDPDSPDSSVVLPTLSVPFQDCSNCLFGPSNGLFCLVDGNVVVMCNPSLREFELLPPTPFSWPEGYTCISFSGFGYDARSNSYKLLHIWYGSILGDGFFRLDLYNSSTNSWRHIHDESFGCYSVISDLVFNGAFHWLTEGEYSDEIGVILSFDISTEIFTKFEFPDYNINPALMNIPLIVLNDCLAVVLHSGCDDYPDFLEVWIMKEYGVNESWMKELVINSYNFTQPYVCWKNEWLLVESDGKLAFCALHANEFRQYQLPEKGECCDALIFRQSLISVKEAFCWRKD